MLRIRGEQMQVFARLAAHNFDEFLLRRVREAYPKHGELLGEPGLREVIRLGREKAAGYGLTSERGLSFYLDLMMVYGSGFDADPQLPWAAEILNDPAIPDEPARLELLAGRAGDFFRRVAGERGEHIEAALARAGRERLTLVPPPGTPEFYTSVLERLEQLYPQKAQAVGELNLRRLIQRGASAAQGYGLGGGRGAALYIGLMFLLGSGFDADPQFGWAATILQDETLDDGGRKVERLYCAAQTFLQQWLGEAAGG